MAQWNLSQIRLKIRQVTGRLTTDEITNEELDIRINQYYQLRFPAEVKLEQKLTYYKFLTTANQSYYDVPDITYTNYEPPVTVNNFNVLWYQSPVKFENDNLNTVTQYTFSSPWTGDGSTVSFSTGIIGFPIFPGKSTISDTVETFWDTNQDWTTSNVVITGSEGGTMILNYSTGLVQVTFNTAPESGQLINFNYVIFKPGRPQAMLYYNNQFQFLPPPDQAYVVSMGAYKIVDALVQATDTPELNEWGPCIAYGTALGIFADYGENDSYLQTTALHKEQIGLVYSRTEQDLLNVRALPNF